MNSVVAEWLRPWEFVSRASCWRGQDDLFGAHGKVKPAGLPIPPRLTTEATRAADPPPSDDGGHACMVASIVRSGSIGAGHVLNADLPRLTTEARLAEWHRHSCVWLAAGVDQRLKCLFHLVFMRLNYLNCPHTDT